MRPPPPASVDELLRRADHLAGRTLGDLAAAIGWPLPADARRAKGKIGELVEACLGAPGGAAAVDFPALGVEVKTVPVDAAGRPRESTFVCRFPLADADQATWATSRVREKLAAVLFVPVDAAAPVPERRLGAARLWRPGPDEEAELAADFDDIVGLLGVGGVDQVTAHRGRVLQLRPKAPDGSARTLAFGPDGEPLATVPRGFYLRRAFVARILAGPALS